MKVGTGYGRGLWLSRDKPSARCLVPGTPIKESFDIFRQRNGFPLG